jgi:hypothetical protein
MQQRVVNQAMMRCPLHSSTVLLGQFEGCLGLDAKIVDPRRLF